MHIQRRDKCCVRARVCVTRHSGGKSLGANDRGRKWTERIVVDLLSRVGGGFELAVNRKLSVARTHKTCTPRIRTYTLFHGGCVFRPATSLTKFLRGQEFCVLFSGIFSTLVSNILSLTVFFARGDEIFFFFFNLSFPSFVCVLETAK